MTKLNSQATLRPQCLYQRSRKIKAKKAIWKRLRSRTGRRWKKFYKWYSRLCKKNSFLFILHNKEDWTMVAKAKKFPCDARSESYGHQPSEI